MDVMNFARTLNDEQRMILDTVREAAAEKLAPAAEAIDHEAALSPSIRAAIAELGLYGIDAPESLGGAALGTTSLILATVEIARASVGAALDFLLTTVRAVEVLKSSKAAGAAALAEALIAGDLRAAWFSGHEPGLKAADRLGLKIEAHGTAFLVDGTAQDVLGAPDAQGVLIASADAPVLWIPFDAEGVVIGPKKHRLGARAVGVADLAFRNVKVPVDNVLLAGKAAGEALARSESLMHLGLAAAGAGLVGAILAQTVGYAKDRRQFGRSISDFEAMREKIADMQATETTAVELVMAAAAVFDRGGDGMVAARTARLATSRAVVRAADDGVQVHGGYGFSSEYPAERYYRDAAYLSAALGGQDILRIDIAKAVVEG